MKETIKESFLETINNCQDKTLPVGFIDRIKEGKLTRDENPLNHLCVYFAAFDPSVKEVFIGHHKKADQWIFNGGHIDKGEIPKQTLEREMAEEWGKVVELRTIGEPRLLTMTHINSPRIQCTKHYDIWFFVPVSKESFNPDKSLLDTEFHTTGWKTIEEAKRLITDPNTIKAISKFESIFSK